MVSGIGPASTLQQLNIPILSDLPGVGQNMWVRNPLSPPPFTSPKLTKPPGPTPLRPLLQRAPPHTLPTPRPLLPSSPNQLLHNLANRPPHKLRLRLLRLGKAPPLPTRQPR